MKRIGQHWRDEETKRLVDLIKAGKSYSDAGDALGRSERAVKGKLARLRRVQNEVCGAHSESAIYASARHQQCAEIEEADMLPCSIRPWTPEDDAELARRFLAGETHREIAKALNRSPTAVQMRVSRKRDDINVEHRRPANPRAECDLGGDAGFSRAMNGRRFEDIEPFQTVGNAAEKVIKRLKGHG